jgi:hypothetical protein
MAGRSDSFRGDLEREGYSQEEGYFYKLNRELIDRRRRELDARRAAQKLETQKSAHWMKCPKCSGEMETVDLMKIYVERCVECQGVYLDAGELETLLQAQESEKLVSKVKKLFLVREGEPKGF